MGRDVASDTSAGAPEKDLIDDLSVYLDVLSSGARLRILKLLSTRSMDATSISREIETSYENTKKHLDRLLSIGVIRKEAGIGRETSKGVHPVHRNGNNRDHPRDPPRGTGPPLEGEPGRPAGRRYHPEVPGEGPGEEVPGRR
jgi:hypothetical protein